MTRRAALLAGVLLAVLVAAGVAVAWTGEEPDDCPVPTPSVEGQDEFVHAADLAPEGSVGEERQPVLEAVEGLGGPFGPVTAGRFYPGGAEVPTLVPVGDAVALATAGSFHVVSVPDGESRWAREYAGSAARGGLVGEEFVVLVGGPAPALVSFAPGGGQRTGCVSVPVAGGGPTETLLTDQAGADVVVGAAPVSAPLTLSMIEPGGSVRWDQQLAGLGEAGSLTVAGASAVVSRLGPDPVRRADMAAAGGIAGPMLTAYSLADGTASWSYPPPHAAASTAVSVVGRDDDTGLLLVLTSAGGGTSKQSVATLAALDERGRDVWTARLGRGYWDAALWGPTVVAQGADPSGGAQLRAFSVDEGGAGWTLRSRQLPSRGPDARSNFGTAVAVGDRYVLPAPNGLLAVDPVTGDHERLDSVVPLDLVSVIGGHAILRAGQALLVVELR